MKDLLKHGCAARRDRRLALLFSPGLSGFPCMCFPRTKVGGCPIHPCHSGGATVEPQVAREDQFAHGLMALGGCMKPPSKEEGSVRHLNKEWIKSRHLSSDMTPIACS